MMKKIALIVFSTVFIPAILFAADGMLTQKSVFSVEETTNRMENILKEKGMTVFNRINHSEGAAGVGIDLRDTSLLIFGNPKAGSPLMKCQQSIAIDLPQKALIWEDENGDVWISWNDPQYLVNRHVVEGCGEVIANIEKALAGISRAAATE